MTRSDQRVIRRGGAPVEEHRSQNKENKFSASFLIILVSLLFVAVFGGALVGGVVSGDPSNGFFITILAASGVAIGVAAIVGLRYWCKQREASKQQEGVTKIISSRDARGDIRGTITRTADEDEEIGYSDGRDRYYHSQGPVEERIQEVEAPRMTPGDVSAMSPGTFDYESYAQTRSQFTRSEYNGNGYRLNINQREHEEYRPSPFDFESVTSKRSLPTREDPPEDIGCNLYCGAPVSKDPSAAIATADGNLLPEEPSDVDLNSPAAMSQNSRSVRSRYDVEEYEETDDQARICSAEGGKHKKRESSNSPDKDKKYKDNDAPPPPPPRSTRSTSKRSTPTASEAGSAVSSIFLKPFAGMFGKKRTTSEAGYSDASTNIKGSETGANMRVTQSKMSKVGSERNLSGNEGKPPMPGRKNNEDKRRGLDTIGRGVGDDRYNPSTPGKNSTFSIPPPRRVPSTPGSEAPSEFRSMAGSSVFSNGVASSTFDAKAHERAIRRTQRNTAALGAAFTDMPIYYEDNESAVSASVAPSAVPSEPTARSIGYDVFAPPGPIGIVVDTISKGCIVHSLKKTSPMQGLINPGDLIVALDDFDVRQMDAASLTKLMAKKSQQKERKFTLIPAEEYE